MGKRIREFDGDGEIGVGDRRGGEREPSIEGNEIRTGRGRGREDGKGSPWTEEEGHPGKGFRGTDPNP